MSFSFNFTAKTKAEARQRIALEMAGVIERDPAHTRDMRLVMTTADAYLDMLHEDPTKGINVQVNGSIGWQWDDADPSAAAANISSASIGVSMWHVPMPA